MWVPHSQPRNVDLLASQVFFSDLFSRLPHITEKLVQVPGSHQNVKNSSRNIKFMRGMVEDRARKRSRGWLVWGLGNHIIGNLLCKQKVWSNGVTWLFMHVWKTALGLCGLLRGKESAYQSKRCRFNPWVRKIPWRKKWQPTPLCLPGESHGQRSLAGNSPWGLKESDVTEYTHTLAQAANYIRKKE